MNSIRIFESFTPVYYWNRDSKKRFVVNQGGTSSSKTYSIDQVLGIKAIKEKAVITVVAKTANALERGALRDFKTLIDSSSNFRALIEDPSLVRGPYRFKSGSVIEFVNLNDPDNAKHGKRDYLFLNEANTIDYEAARQLMIRTRNQIFIDYNPDARFWVHDELQGKEDCDFFISNFKHNPWCPEETVKDLLEYKRKWETSGNQNLRKRYVRTGKPEDFLAWDRTSNKFWKNKWYVYGLGLTGIVEGVIFDDIHWINHLPLGMIKKAYALDFGFKNDPTALAKCGMKRGNVYGKELIYETGLTTPDLIHRIKLLGINKKDLIIADPANPDAIAQMQRKGFNVVPATKGPGSVEAGLDALRGHDIYLTRDSKNWKKEQENYKYAKKNGQWTNKPIDAWNHLWDDLRYYYQHFYPTRRIRKRSRSPRKVKVIR